MNKLCNFLYSEIHYKKRKKSPLVWEMLNIALSEGAGNMKERIPYI